jgi:hypothetical protein
MRYPPGWPPRTRQAGGWAQPGIMLLAKQWRPKSPGVLLYQVPVQSQIGGYGVAQGIIGAGGGAQVQVGPSGLGTIWYPQQAVLATTTGTEDTSTCVGYLGPPSPVASSILFTSYAGGGDVQGIAVPVLQPGDFITCVWSGGHPGDHATLRVLGALQALVPVAGPR